MSYEFLQQYWWFVVSLLGGLLVFLLFVQGGNSLLLNLPENEAQRKMMINSTGRKWEFTFTTLVTFGGAFFASFPLFYSTSFGGAYWVWMLLLFTFVVQAVSYEFQSKLGNLLGKNTYRWFLIMCAASGEKHHRHNKRYCRIYIDNSHNLQYKIINLHIPVDQADAVFPSSGKWPRRPRKLLDSRLL